MKDQKKSICCVGHITRDRIITPRITSNIPGGTAFYFAHALHSLGDTDFSLITAVGPKEMNVVEDLRKEGIDVVSLPSDESVFFENKYGADSNNRTQKVLAKAAPFTAENLQKYEADVFHLGTLLADDFSTDVLKSLSQRATVSVDAQGYLREVRGEDVFAVDWPDKREAMKYIDILKANEKEMEVLTGTSEPRIAAKVLAEWGCKEVLLTLGDKGSVIYADGDFFEVPAYPVEDVVDATGCGDTYMAGYLYARCRGTSYEEAGKFASAMCTIKLGGSGPFHGSLEDVALIMGQMIV